MRISLGYELASDLQGLGMRLVLRHHSEPCVSAALGSPIIEIAHVGTITSSQSA
jgi:hypothetical protein